ncbi:anthranilate synthase component I family protein [Pedobacter immunditicola]|uniref:anthranilate synthase component I family protein n=1 Tax=Pedobacter immunditicola TaxID=3133440 RepID=UPI0030AB70D8
METTIMHPDNLFKQKALAWADTFEVCAVLDSNTYPDVYHQYDLLIAAGVRDELNAKCGTAFDELKAFYNKNRSWMFGLLSYDLKNETEALHSSNPDPLAFPDLFFFIPEYLLAVTGTAVEVLLGPPDLLQQIEKTILKPVATAEVQMQSSLTKSKYIQQVKILQEHIIQGDCYEITFCQDFFAKNAKINPLAVFNALNRRSSSPFGGYFKIRDHYILSASPERFLCKRGQQLISQPIKGTAKRSPDSIEDQQNRQKLKESRKEQAENVMIVDLVRNDLTKSAVPGTVMVAELFGIYSFPQVHQMISTVTCELNPEIHFIDALKNTFPMGSMTGAPKIKAMQLIEELENSKRGAFSGSMGYISPDGNFDFNVMIRTLLYKASTAYLSFKVGSAITYQSDAESEYEECLLKASAMLETLKGLNEQPL